MKEIYGNTSTSGALQHLYNFKIVSDKPISKKFREINIGDFETAALFIKNLPYRRNKDKSNLQSVFTDACGTCGTKHALLKTLANENSVNVFKLKTGIFKMHGQNTKSVAATLEKYQLDYIPEAHNYLTIDGEILDYTWPGSGIPNIKYLLLAEIEITPEQITDFKINYHKTFLKAWILEEKLHYTLEQLWAIREECIIALSNQ